jgi:sugar lactone lactonase YvrE
MYPNQTVYLASYNNNTGSVSFSIENYPSQGQSGGLTITYPFLIPTDARFFVIQFYDSNPQSTNPIDPTNVAKVSVLNKAFEISQVIKAITGITGAPNVNIVAHSMGGLDARAYAENMASAGACYDYSISSVTFQDYSTTTCTPGTGSAAYSGDVATIITVDTPHAGSPLANSWGAPLTGLTGDGCQATTTTNSFELVPGNALLNALNYNGYSLGYNNKLPDNLSTPIQAIMDYASDVNVSWTKLAGYSDDIVPQPSQSIQQNVPAANDSAPLTDIWLGYPGSNFAATAGCNASLFGVQTPVPMIHPMSCLGAFQPTQQAITTHLINDTVPWVSFWNVTPSTLSLGSTVTIQYTATDLSTSTLSNAELWRAPFNYGQPLTWEKVASQSLSGNVPRQITFTDIPTAEGTYYYGTHLFDSAGNEAMEPSPQWVIVTPSASQAPTVTTVSATPVSSTNATLNGTINANGSATQYLFVYGTSQTLAGAASTVTYGIGAGTSPQAVSANAPGLSAGKTYYYQLQASNSTGPKNGSILSFITPSAGKTTPTVLVTPSSSNITTAQTLTVTVSVSGSNGTPTGSVTLSGGGYTSSAATLSGGSAPINIPAGLLATGSDTLTVSYTPDSSSSSTYNSASGTASVTVAVPAKTAPTVLVSPLSSSITTAQPLSVLVTVSTTSGNPTPTGTVTVTVGSYTSAAQSLTNASTTINIPAGSLSAGTYTPTASYSGDTKFSSASGSAPSHVTVTGGATATLTVSVSGSGTVNSTDGHINCPGTCSYAYSVGASITLNANPASGYYGQWSGCDGGSNTCLLTMSQSRTVSFVFAKQATGSLLVQPPSFTFGPQVIETASTITSASATNMGQVPLDPVSVTVTGPNSGDFREGNNCPGTTLNAGYACTISLQFVPTGVGIRTASLSVFSANATIPTQVIPLSGTGSLNPTVSVTPSSSSISTTQPISLEITVSGTQGTPTGTVALYIGSSYYVNNPLATATLVEGNAQLAPPAGSLSVGSNILSVIYTPNAGSASIYVSAYGSATVTVAAADSYIAPTEPVGSVGGTQTATILLTSSFTLGSFAVVTQGEQNLDFNYAPGGTCTVGTAYTAGQTCTVNYTFKPTAPGTRTGAFTIFDNTSPTPVPQASVFLNGMGTGPLANFLPGTQSAIGSGLYDPYGVAVDGGGSLYISDTSNNRVLKETLSAGNYIQTTIGSGLAYPNELAVDGSGNIYIADTGNSRVLMETLSAGSYIQSTVGSGLSNPDGVAVDGSGNVYIADTGNNRVLMETPLGGSFIQSTVASNGLDVPTGVAVDGIGNVYIADSYNNRVLKETLSAGNYTQTTIGNGLSTPMGIAMDGIGNVYIADSYNNRVLKETLSAGNYTQTTIGNGLSIPMGVAVDAIGNVYIADANNSRVLKEDLVDPPSLSFATTNVGSTSGDSPQMVTLSNIGNAALTLPIPTTGNNPSIAANFTLNSTGGTACPLIGSTTSSAGTLAVGASCILPISFAPTAVGSISGSLVLTDNSLNGTNVKQTISLSGTATQVLQTIVFTPPNSPVTFGISPNTLSATGGGSGNPVTFSIVSGPGTISGSTLTITSVGTIVVAANQAGNTNYAAATQVTQSIVVNRATPTITFTVPNHTFGDAPITVAATSNSSGAITYSVVSGPATISGSTVTLTGAGAVVLQASQVAASNYAASTQTATFIVAGNAPTISFSVPSHTYGDAPFTVSATSNSGGAITYSVVSGPATISGSTVTVTSAGSVVLQASQVAAGNYTAGTQTATVTVAKESQTITFSAPVSPVNYGVAPISPSASANSGLTMAFSVLSGPGTISGSTLTITGVGTVVVAANQAGNANYAAATQVTQSIVVNQASQTITFTAPTSPVTYGVSPIALVATGGASVNAVVYSVVSGPATVSGSTLTITGAGMVVVAANQAGNANYSAAAQVTQSIVVNTASQTINFTAPASPVTYGVSPITLSASSTSGLAVTFSVVSGPGTVSGSTLTITGVGPVVVAANQAGNTNYSAATQVTQSIVVNVIGAAATPTFSPVAGTYTSTQTVSISDTTSGATIYYTTNGTTPTTSSTVYTSAIPVASTETLQAIATATGYSTSAVASAAYTISIPTNPVPAISGISPAYTDAGRTVFTLTVNGSGFIASSMVYWGASALTTTYVTATQLTAQVPAADIASAGTVTITVQNPAPGGGTSNAWQFEVDSASSGSTAPTITSTTETVAAGSTANYPVTVPSSVASVYVTCLNLPTGASCSYSSTTNTVTIATSLTTPKGTYQIIMVFTETVSGAASGFILLPILLLPLGFMRRKLAARGIWLTACLGLVLMATAALSIGCGGGSSGGLSSTTPPATHQVTSSDAVSLTIQ